MTPFVRGSEPFYQYFEQTSGEEYAPKAQYAPYISAKIYESPDGGYEAYTFDAPRYEADLAARRAAAETAPTWGEYDAAQRALYALEYGPTSFQYDPAVAGGAPNVSRQLAMALGMTPAEYRAFEEQQRRAAGNIDNPFVAQRILTDALIDQYGLGNNPAVMDWRRGLEGMLTEGGEAYVRATSDKFGIGDLLKAVGFVLGAATPLGWGMSLANMVGSAAGLDPRLLGGLSALAGLGSGMLGLGGQQPLSGFDRVGDMGGAAYNQMMNTVAAPSFIDTAMASWNSLPAWQQQAIKLAGKTGLSAALGEKIDPFNLALGAADVGLAAYSDGALDAPRRRAADAPYGDIGYGEDWSLPMETFSRAPLFSPVRDWGPLGTVPLQTSAMFIRTANPVEGASTVIDLATGAAMSVPDTAFEFFGAPPLVDIQTAANALNARGFDGVATLAPVAEALGITLDAGVYAPGAFDFLADDADYGGGAAYQFAEPARDIFEFDETALQRAAPAMGDAAYAFAEPTRDIHEFDESALEPAAPAADLSALDPRRVLALARALLPLLRGTDEARRATHNADRVVRRAYSNEAERQRAYAQHAADLLATMPEFEALGLDPRELQTAFGTARVDPATGRVVFEMGEQAGRVFNQLMDAANAVIGRVINADVDKLTAEEFARAVEQLHAKRDKQLADLTRALYARGLLGLLTYEQSGVNPFTGETESWVLPEGQGANPYFAATFAGWERETADLARKSREEAERYLQTALDHAGGLLGRLGTMDTAVLDALGGLGATVDAEQDAKRRRLSGLYSQLVGPGGAHVARLEGMLPSGKLAAALADVDQAELMRRRAMWEMAQRALEDREE